MRLIDADEFDKKMAIAQSECKRNGGNFRYGVLNQLRGNLAEMPTIDAIPVEWMQEQCKVFASMARGGHHSAWIIKALILQWHKEQEAKTV